MLEELSRRVHEAVSGATADETRFTWRGHPGAPGLIDGSSFSMPDTPELKEHFGQPCGQKIGCGFPVAHLLALFDLHPGAPGLAEPVASPLYTSDLKHAPLMHGQMGNGDVLLGDEYFSNWGHFALILRDGLHAVMPNHHRRIVNFAPRRRHAHPRDKQPAAGRPRSRWIQSLGRNDQLVEWFKPLNCPLWMSQEQYDELPDAIIIREIRRTLRRPGFRPITVTILTTLLDPDLYPADELVALRMKRWEAETDLRHLKTTMNMEVLRCKSVQGVLKELAVFVLVYPGAPGCVR